MTAHADFFCMGILAFGVKPNYTGYNTKKEKIY